MSIQLRENRIFTSGEELGNLLLQLIDENLDLGRWNFHLSYKNFLNTSKSIAIYDSDKCRLSFMFSRGRSHEYDELSIEYGRLHASNESPIIELQGEKCRCWHQTANPVRFLDGLSPAEAMKQSKTQKLLPPVIENFQKSDTGKKILNEYPPKFAIALQSILWDHYGQGLFELFDLKRNDLWEKYRKFLKDYYELIGMKADHEPQYHEVC